MAVLAHEGTHTIISEMIPIPIGSGLTNAYLSRPDSAGPSPVAIVLHGIAGLDSTTKHLCRSLARNGFMAVAPDWYRGEGPRDASDFEEGFRAYARTSDRRVLALLEETVEYLSSDDIGGPGASEPVVVGVDLGGRLALLHAAHGRSVAAVAAVYAPLRGDEERDLRVADAIGVLGVPVLGLYGADDELIPADDVDAAQAATPNGQWILYEGVGHGFLDSGQAGYDAGAEADAMARLIKLAATSVAG